MKKFGLLAIVLLCSLSVFSQRGRSRTPVLKDISEMEVIKTIYPTAEKTDQLNDVWFKITDSGGGLLGYSLSSKPFSAGIIGYLGPTPVLIVMNTDKVIQKVSILSHQETQSYITRLERMGFFNNWTGLPVDEAKQKNVYADVYTGATISAESLIENVDIVLHKAITQLISTK